MKLNVLVQQDEGGYFVANVPALPGCLSQGWSHDEALGNIKEAIEEWLEIMEAKKYVDMSQAIEIVV